MASFWGSAQGYPYPAHDVLNPKIAAAEAAKECILRGVVDVGSNSVKYAVALATDSTLRQVRERSWVTRLAKNLKPGAPLSPEAVTQTRDVFLEIAQDFEKLGVLPENRVVVGTAALRMCSNPQLVQELSKEILGAPLQVLSGPQEAQWSFRGSMSAVGSEFPHSPLVVVDVGGASTEVSVPRPQLLQHSFDAGAVVVAAQLGIQDMPVAKDAWTKARNQINTMIPSSQLQGFARWPESEKACGVAVGGALVIAAKILDAKKIGDRGFAMRTRDLDDLADHVARLDQTSRLALGHGIEGREDVFPAGVLCLTHVLRAFGISEVMVTLWGLRHGILLGWNDFFGPLEGAAK
jgi:exopolyphosphatase/guanosine-5'-triphosphate,3'-diphosphate pyrophosphatase